MTSSHIGIGNKLVMLMLRYKHKELLLALYAATYKLNDGSLAVASPLIVKIDCVIFWLCIALVCSDMLFLSPSLLCPLRESDPCECWLQRLTTFHHESLSLAFILHVFYKITRYYLPHFFCALISKVLTVFVYLRSVLKYRVCCQCLLLNNGRADTWFSRPTASTQQT